MSRSDLARSPRSAPGRPGFRGACRFLVLLLLAPLLAGATCEVTDIGWPGEHWPGGIGAILGHSSTEHRLVVREVPPDSPAARAGLRVDDEVLAIDDREVAEMDLEEVIERLRGEVGTLVKLQLRRGDEELELEVERGPYQSR